MQTSVLSALVAFAVTAIVALAAIILAAMPSHAEIDYPWCSMSSIDQSGMPSCRFSTHEQCLASVAGSGWCQRNSRLVWQEQQAKQRGVR